MKFKGTKLSKRTIALFAAALVLLGSGGVTATRAVPAVIGETFDTKIETPEVLVALTENGKTLEDKATIFENIGYKDSQGTKVVEPGKTYANPIGVVNTGTADEYIRVVVRKYWTTPEKVDGHNVDTGEKDTELSPDLIILTQAGGWTEKAGPSDETKIYYYSKPVAVGDKVKLFDSVRIAGSVADLYETDETTVETPEGNATIVTYKYAYDGYTFHIEAEAQGVQTHSPDKAIKSVWGVEASSVGIN